MIARSCATKWAACTNGERSASRHAGPTPGDAQIFINLVDNPRLDFDYTVFARVCTGMTVVDEIAEGDRIAQVQVLPPSDNCGG